MDGACALGRMPAGPRPRSESAVLGDADLLAHVEDRTLGAAGEGAGADVLAEGDEQAVDLDAVGLGEDGSQGGLGQLGGASLDVAPAVGDAVDVDVDADPRL